MLQLYHSTGAAARKASDFVSGFAEWKMSDAGTVSNAEVCVSGRAWDCWNQLMRDDLIEFVRAEVSAEEQKVLTEHQRRIRTRVNNGHCITGLKFKEVDCNGYFVYSFSENLSKFRSGDLLVINEGKPQGEDVMNNGVLVWLQDIDHSKQLIKLDKDQEIDPPRGSSCTVDMGFYDYNSERIKHSIELAYESDQVVELLEGRVRLCRPDQLSATDIAKNRQDYPGLTLRQSQALVSSASGPATLIQGPPGSGKTFLLSLIIERALATGDSILVTAPTHKAIEHLLTMVAERLPESDLPIIKIQGKGKPANLSPRISQTNLDDPTLLELRSPFLIGATVYQSYRMHRAGMPKFDLVVVDEAGQMTIAHAMPALISGDRYVISGDHRQLSPVFVNPGAHPDYLKRSVFEHLHEHYSSATITLDVTFRMNSGVNEFPSKAFYSSKLRPSACAANRVFAPEQNACGEFCDVICNVGAVTYLELEHQNARQRAVDEADLVARLARDLLAQHRVAPKDLAIVSPHRAHNEAIRERLLAHVGSEMQSSVKEQLVVDTVDRLQGQERDVIIFSLCASDREYAISRAQFLYSPNRLNVAITRSRLRLFLVGSRYFFPHQNGILVDSKLLKLWESYYEYLVENRLRVVYNQPSVELLRASG
jgi:DNA replication ATP-dependent helicase Dna2